MAVAVPHGVAKTAWCCLAGWVGATGWCGLARGPGLPGDQAFDFGDPDVAGDFGDDGTGHVGWGGAVVGRDAGVGEVPLDGGGELVRLTDAVVLGGGGVGVAAWGVVVVGAWCPGVACFADDGG